MVDVRVMQPRDSDAMGQIMWDAIHNAPSRYDRAQRLAWAPTPPAGPDWAEKLAAQLGWVARDAGEPVGFVTLAAGGYVNLAFVRPDVQGRGVFSALLQALETTARAQGLARLSTHASLAAQPAFAARGFHIIAHETVERAGQRLDRAEMRKALP